MRHIAMLAVLAGTIVTSACSVTRSLNPLYTDKDLVTEPRLEGRWTDEDAKDVWEVRPDGKGYVVTRLGDAEMEALSVHIVVIGRSVFLDVAPKSTPSLAIDGHLFLKMHFEDQELVLQMFDWAWLRDKTAQAGVALVDTADREHILTAPTADLQRFVSMYAEEARAFDADAGRMHKVR